MARELKKWLICWLLLVAIIFCFLVWHIQNPFYADDYYHLAFVKFMPDPPKLVWKYNFGSAFWRPLILFSDYYNLRLLGLKPMGWHIIDLLLHSFNALLVAALLYMLLESSEEKWRMRMSFLGGIMFAIHPLALLTAAWFACRGDLLATFFSMLALLLFLSAAKAKKMQWHKIILAMALALVGFLLKETALVLPGTALVLLLFFPESRSLGRKLRDPILALIVFFAAAALYFFLRFNLLGSFKGYEQIEFNIGWVWQRLSYHLPRVLCKSFRDYILWHLPLKSGWSLLIICSYVVLMLIGIRSLLKSVRFALAGILWVLVNLIPYWNLSHMFAYGEARWLYFGLVGMTIIVAGAVNQMKSTKLRFVAVFLFLAILAALGRDSFAELGKFHDRSDRYEKVRKQIVKALPMESSGPRAKRIYVYGLDSDFYYLDLMVKVYHPELLDRIIIPVNIPSMAWVTPGVLSQPEPNKTIAPQIETLYADGKNAVISVKPPEDLIQASDSDPQAMVLEWRILKFAEITPDLIQLSHERVFMEANYSNPHEEKLFPNYSFRKRNYPLDWELSPGIKLVAPFQAGDFYTFISRNDDPYLISPDLEFFALPTAEMELGLKIEAKKYLAPQEQEGCFFWMTDKDTDWQANQKISFPVIADGKFHTYKIRLDRNYYWLISGTVARIRLDPISFPGRFQLDSINFSPAAR